MIKNMTPEVIYENKAFVVLNKPAGILVHTTNALRHEKTLVEWLLKKYPDIKHVGDDPEIRPGIVHRLDKDTSGVLLIARTKEAFQYFKKLFQEKKIIKTYYALVWGKTEHEGVINKPIGLKQGTIRHATQGKHLKMIKEAETKYNALRYFKKNGELFTLLAITPKTGRTHQIRVHMRTIGHPIVGDVIYSSKTNIKKARELGFSRLFLHADSLEFLDPSGKRITVGAGLPSEWEEALASIESVHEELHQRN
jgi:23S rRNA pseudouridine1911/1915/1917 synthase